MCLTCFCLERNISESEPPGALLITRVIYTKMSIGNYIKETRGELSHVSWPTRKQAIGFTALVIGVSVVLSIYLGAADFLLSRIVKLIVS